MGLEKHPVLVSVLVSKKLSGLGLGLGLEACGLDYNTGSYPPIGFTSEFSNDFFTIDSFHSVITRASCCCIKKIKNCVYFLQKLRSCIYF